MSTVALTIDYSNGAQKHFSNIPWTKNLTILDALQAVARIPPGAEVNFGSDRSGHTLDSASTGCQQRTRTDSNGLSGSTRRPSREGIVWAPTRASGSSPTNARRIS